MPDSKEKLFNFAALCLWLIMSAGMAGYLLMNFGQDFRGYYAAARVLIERGNPYEYEQVARVLIDVTGRAGNNPFYYPLWFGWFVAPLSFFPFQVARAVWMFINWGLWLFGSLRLQRLLNFPARGWRGWLLNLLITFIFAWTTWKFEQTGILLFVITVEILLAYQEQHWDRMGIWLALALIKPNVMMIPVIVCVLWLWKRKNWQPIFVAGGILLALVLVTTVVTPNWYKPFMQPHFGQGLTEVLDGPGQVTGTRLNTTLLDWLKWFGIPVSVRYGIYFAAVLASFWIIAKAIQTSRPFMEMVIISLLVSFAITPYALQYDFPPLTVVLFWALACSQNTTEHWIPTLIVGFIASVLIWERPISDGYWIVVGLSALAYWVFSRPTKMIFIT